MKWKEEQESAAKWCKIDHVHGPNCKAPAAGCSHDHSDVCFLNLITSISPIGKKDIRKIF